MCFWSYAGKGNGEKFREGRGHSDVHRAWRGGRQLHLSVDQHGGVPGQMPVRRVPSHTERGRAVLLRVLGRPLVQLEFSTSDIRSERRAACPGY